MNKRKIFRWVKIIALLYAVIGIVLFWAQDKLLFHPGKLSPDHVFKFDQKFEEVNIPFNETDTMNMIKFFSNDSIPKGIVVYYHGNMDNVEHYAEFAKPFTKAGYEVWMEDYPGFGKSTGTIDEEKLYTQAVEVKRMADQKIGSDKVIIYGKSLGTGIAAYVASVSTPSRSLIMETPYYSIPALFSTYAFIYPVSKMCNYKIPTHKYVEEVKFPVIIFHGTKDGVIPYSCAAKLKTNLKTTDKFITVTGADHQNINAQQIYFSTIDSLLR